MKLFQSLAAAFALVSTSALADPPSAETRGSLEKLVPAAIQMLEAKNYAEVLNTLVPPDELAKLTEINGGMEKFAEKFAEKKAAQVLNALKAVKDLKPEMSDNDTTATYKLPEGTDSPRKTIVFTKIKDIWYIKN